MDTKCKNEGSLFSIPQLKNGRMKTKSNHLAFIHEPSHLLGWLVEGAHSDLVSVEGCKVEIAKATNGLFEDPIAFLGTSLYIDF